MAKPKKLGRTIFIIAVIAIFAIVIIITRVNSQKGETKMYAIMKTNYGTMKIQLYPDKAPITVANFVKYADSGFYNNTIFHRVIPSFMIQGGGFNTNGTEKPTMAPIKNEANNGLENLRGTVAMARTSVINSATAQFFINLVNNSFLNYKNNQDYGYAVFGKVIEGMNVADKIAQVKTETKGPYQDWPKQNVIIKSVTIEKQ